jgi:hypothetical protein
MWNEHDNCVALCLACKWVKEEGEFYENRINEFERCAQRTRRYRPQVHSLPWLGLVYALGRVLEAVPACIAPHNCFHGCNDDNRTDASLRA